MASAAQPAPESGAGAAVRSDSIDRQVRVMAGPPVRAGRLIGWVGLGLCLLAALPPLLVELGRPDVLDPQEAQALAVSRHTAAALSTDRPLTLGERLAPVLNDRRRADIAPGLHWLHLLALRGLDSAAAEPQAILWRTRLVSAALALVTVASVYWAALSIGGSYSAIFAALVCLGSPLLLYEGRTADGSVASTAFETLAIAAALWAIRPLRAAPSVERQFIGWLVCGLAIAAAVLTTGLGAAVVTIAPILLMLVLCPERQSHLMGLVAATLVAALAVLPWAMLSQELDQAAWRQWLIGGELVRSLALEGPGVALGRRIGWLLLAVAPWTLWLVAAVVQPFSTSSSGTRTRLFLSWAWLAVAVAVYLSVPDAPRRALLPAVTAAAVLMGQLFARYEELAAVARYPRFWRLVRWPHVMLLVIASIAPPLLMGLQPNWVQENRLPSVLIPVTSLNQMLLVGLSVALLLVLGLSSRWTRRHQPGHALAAWSIWVVIYATMAAVLVVRSPLLSHPLVDRWPLVDGLAQGKTIYWLSDRGAEARIDPALLFYAGRPLPPLRPTEIDRLLAERRAGGARSPEMADGPNILVLAEPARDMKTMGQVEAVRLTDFTLAGRTLWRLTPTSPQPGPPPQTQPAPPTTAEQPPPATDAPAAGLTSPSDP